MAPKAITEDSVNAFYTGDDENMDYWDTSEFEEAGQILYALDYGVNGFDIESIGDPPTTWIFTAKSRASDNPVKLYVDRYIYSRKGKRTSGRFETVCLAEYDMVPFQLAVSLNPLTKYPALAPRKHKTLSTLWGEIRMK